MLFTKKSKFQSRWYQIYFTRNSVIQRNNLEAYQNDGNIAFRLMNIKIVRIWIGTNYACVQG